MSCLDKTIWRQFEDALKMYFVHWETKAPTKNAVHWDNFVT